MTALFHQLLDATLQHLQNLKAEGIAQVRIEPGTLDAIRGRKPGPAPAPSHKTHGGPNPGPQPPPTPAPSAQPPPPPTAPNRVTAPSPTPAPIPSLPAMTREEKESAMADLREKVLRCELCPHLSKSRTKVVFGVGDIHAPLMFVGEAPGADEDLQGEPFVGKAGQLLTRIIQTMGLDRDRVYIANILKCRPDTPGQASGNRKPTPQEIQTCTPHLMRQMDIIRPSVIVALGGTAVEGLLGNGPCFITRARGSWMEFRGVPVMPTYHPSYLLRNQSLQEKRRVWEDMLAVMERLGMTITTKHQNYFLKTPGSEA